MSAKLKRLNRIKELLAEEVITSHEDLLQLLAEEGIEVTQATLSRDFAELGVIRTTTENGPKYILDAQESGRQISRLIGFEIMGVDHNESLIVVRTLAGRAQGIAHYIDRMNHEQILGTVAGDDTVLIIPNSQKNIMNLVQLVKNMMEE